MSVALGSHNLLTTFLNEEQLRSFMGRSFSVSLQLYTTFGTICRFIVLLFC
jgi:hypothetical protein